MESTQERLTNPEVIRNPQLLAEIRDEYVRDDNIERSRFEPQWNQNTRMYLNDMKPSGWATRGRQKWIDVPRIHHAIQHRVATILEEMPNPELLPRETNEEPDYFVRSDEYTQTLMEMGVSEQAATGAVPIDSQVVMFLTEPQPTGQIDGMTGEPIMGEPLVPMDAFIAVDDQLAADAYTQELRSQWSIANGDRWLTTNVYNTNIFGHRDVLVQFDPNKYQIELVDIYPFNSWIDRFADDTTNAERYILRQYMPLSEAKKEYPELAVEDDNGNSILSELAGQTDMSNQPGSNGRKYRQMEDRDVIERWTLWQRDVPYPMDEEKALSMGKVTIEPSFEIDEFGQAVPSQVYVNEDGEQTEPGADNWPIEYAWRQAELLGDVELYDGRADAVDIPVARNKNRIYPDSPYGIGEPQFLHDICELYDRLYSIVHDYFLYYRSPEQVMPVSVANELKTAVKTIHSTAGRVIQIPDRLYRMFGSTDIIRNLPVPQINNAVTELLGRLELEIEKMSGVNEAMMGIGKSEWSGETVQSLTTNARSPIGLAARNTEFMVKHVVKVAIHYIVDFTPAKVLAERNKKYPEPVWNAFKKRLKKYGFDVYVEISGSSTKSKQVKEILDMFQYIPSIANSTTAIETALKKVGIPNAAKIAGEVAIAMQPAPEEQSVQ